MQPETIREFVDSRGQPVRVDRQRGVIEGVKILGLESRNGRRYLPQALSQAAGLYEGAKVNVNHAKASAAGPRDYQDRLGEIRRVRLRYGEGLFADLHFNPRHALAEQLIWDAEHAPQNVGLSHNVRARTSQGQDGIVVEAILSVESVDLVADPATTAGLFESLDRRNAPHGADSPLVRETLTPEWLRQHRPELVAALQGTLQEELTSLRTEVERLRLAHAVAERRRLVGQLLEEHRLPAAAPWASEAFMASLFEAADDDAVRRLVAQRAELVGQLRGENRPQSREQQSIEPAAGVKAFVESIS